MNQIFVVSRSRDRLINYILIYPRPSCLQIIKVSPEFLVISDMLHCDCSLIGLADSAYSQVRVRAVWSYSALPPPSQISATTHLHFSSGEGD